MPIKATFRDVSLVGATAHIEDAAKAEKLKPKAVEALWVALTDSQRNGLIEHAKETESSLAGWRAAWPTVLAELNDNEASAVIRVAVMIAGGAIVDDDEKGEERVTDTQAAAKAKKGD